MNVHRKAGLIIYKFRSNLFLLNHIDTYAEFNAQYERVLESTKQLAAAVTQIGAMDQVLSNIHLFLSNKSCYRHKHKHTLAFVATALFSQANEHA